MVTSQATTGLESTLLRILGPATALGPFEPPSGADHMLIDGALVPGGHGTFPNIDPATGEELGRVGSASRADLERAIAAARRAFDTTGWRDDVAFRQHCLRQLGAALTSHADELVATLVAELGCSVRIASNVQVGPVGAKVAHLADAAGPRLATEKLPPLLLGGFVHQREIRHEPIGVVGAITPWNIPLDIAAAKIAGALAAGNALVLKPSPETPYVCNLIGRLILEHTDIPAGIVNIVTSADHELGALLVEDARVDAVSFTGSTRTGRTVMSTAAADLKRVHLELGGKSPSIVLDDVDFSATVPIAAAMGCFNAGQSCILPSRLLVPHERLAECVDLAIEGMRAVRVGDPTLPSSFMGPLVSEAHRSRVAASVDAGRSCGARVVVGGDFDPEEPGFFFRPTLVVDAPPDSSIVKDEIFGPVVVVQPYDDLDDAIRVANDTKFGLAGYVWGADPSRIERVVSAVRVGMVGVNGGNFTSGDMPFGGVGHSGLGLSGAAPGSASSRRSRPCRQRVRAETPADVTARTASAMTGRRFGVRRERRDGVDDVGERNDSDRGVLVRAPHERLLDVLRDRWD